MTDIVIVLTTVADDERAEQLARRLVDEQLAACVTLHPPMVSFYRWRGAIQRDTERQMMIKTTRARLAALEARLTQLHAYELPEFLVVAADGSSEAYMKWIKAETGD
jgi:periplasmic divalent cation tolerance protein